MALPAARFAVIRWATLALAFGVAASCSKSEPNASAHPAGPPQPAALHPAVPPPADGEHGGGKKGEGQWRDSAVYLDGKARGVLRYAELPPGLEPIALPEIDDLDIPRYYRLCDYFTRIGIDVSKIVEMHVYGSHDRVAVISGEELRSAQSRVIFDFTQQVTGKPRARWTNLHALPHHPMVDVILGISLYQDKTPPAYKHGELLVDGQPTDGIPYVEDGVPKGTRVYVDGKLAGWVRRKTLPDKLIAPSSERVHAKFSTDAFLTYVGADSRGAKAIDFYADDALLARVDGRDWAKSKGDYVFDLPNRSHGQVHESFPGDQAARLSSIKLYIRTTPPARKTDPDAFEQQDGSGEAQAGSGNGDGSGGNNGGSSGNAGVTPVAQSVKGSSEDEF
jgi:hypothetical protein